MVLCACVAQYVQGTPDAVTVSFLIMVATSAVHHSRLDTWWTWDVWRALDYIAIGAFACAMYTRFKNRLAWKLACAHAAASTCLIWSGYFPERVLPYMHAPMHVVVGTCVLFLVLTSHDAAA